MGNEYGDPDEAWETEPPDDEEELEKLKKENNFLHSLFAFLFFWWLTEPLVMDPKNRTQPLGVG